jgi:hypothetical protein
MLKALDPTKKDPLPPLNHRLSRLIEKKLRGSDKKMQERLKAIQKTKSVSTT